MSSYAVLWSEPGQPVRAGKLELELESLRFEGALGSRSPRHIHRVAYEDIDAVHVGRGPRERLAGRPALVLDRFVGGPVRIGSVQGVGVLNELAERLGHLTATPLAL